MSERFLFQEVIHRSSKIYIQQHPFSSYLELLKINRRKMKFLLYLHQYVLLAIGNKIAGDLELVKTFQKLRTVVVDIIDGDYNAGAG